MRFAREIEAGIVHINSETAGAEPLDAAVDVGLRHVDLRRQPREHELGVLE